MEDYLIKELKEILNGFLINQCEIENKIFENETNNIQHNNNYFNCIQYKEENCSLNSKIKTIHSILNILDNKEMDIIDFRQDNINAKLQILSIQEKERQRIARDLHDTSLQNLTHLVHKVELSSLYMDKDIIKAKLELVSLNKGLKSVIEEIRNIIFDLRPMSFDDLGIKSTFERLIDKLTQNSEFEIEAYIDDMICSNTLILMTIYRIVEECLNNAVKHSNGNKILLKIENIEKKQCYITICDNGKNFNYNEICEEKDKHFGLYIMKERVELLSGNMKINSKEGEGTIIEIVIPIYE